MKNVILPFFIVLCLSITTNPLCAQWVKVDQNFNGYLIGFCSKGPYLFGVFDESGGVSYAGRIWRSNDNGYSWTILTGDTVFFQSVASDNNYTYASGGGNTWRSSDNGSTWVIAEKDSVVAYSEFSQLVTTNGCLFYISHPLSEGTFIYRSSNAGADWAEADSGFDGAGGGAIFANGGILYALTSHYGDYPRLHVYRSTDNGGYWIDITPLTGTKVPAYSNGLFESVAAVGNTLLVGSAAGVSRFSGDDGSWTYVDSLDTPLYLVAKDSLCFFSGGGENGGDVGIYGSIDTGRTWKEINDGLGGASLGYLAIHDTTIFFSSIDDNTLWRRSINEIARALIAKTTEVREKATSTTKYSIEQNYPNPFNPTTTISYSIPNRSHVTLSVFNTLGQKAAELVNGEKDAGSYNVTFDASGLASGVYLYRMQAGSFVQTRKLVVVK